MHHTRARIVQQPPAGADAQVAQPLPHLPVRRPVWIDDDGQAEQTAGAAADDISRRRDAMPGKRGDQEGAP